MIFPFIFDTLESFQIQCVLFFTVCPFVSKPFDMLASGRYIVFINIGKQFVLPVSLSGLVQASRLERASAAPILHKAALQWTLSIRFWRIGVLADQKVSWRPPGPYSGHAAPRYLVDLIVLIGISQ